MSKSNYYGFETLGKHTTEFGLMCIERSVGFPKKNKTLVQVPFSNAVYDFSNVYGGQTFTERNLSFKFLFNGSRKDELFRIWTRVSNWLINGQTRLPLFDDRMKKYYYLAELSDIQDFEESYEEGYLTITFDCYPFRIYELQEGNDIWDDFDFELDIAQQTRFEINGTKQMALYNAGANTAIPDVATTASMTVTTATQTFVLPAGQSKSTRFRLKTGINNFTVVGQGTLEFIWHKELI